MNKDKALNDEDLRSAELGTNGDAMTKLADAILERYQVREYTGVFSDQSRAESISQLKFPNLQMV